MKGKKGQVLIALLIISLAIGMFILASPILWGVVNQSAAEVGGVPGFLILCFPWIILATLIGVAFRIYTSGGDFF